MSRILWFTVYNSISLHSRLETVSDGAFGVDAARIWRRSDVFHRLQEHLKTDLLNQ